MSWRRATVLVACGLLLQCLSSVNTSGKQSYREALRRKLSSVTWCPPPQPPPCVVVPYPYLQTNCPKAHGHSTTGNMITKGNAAGWPEYRIKLPLYMGRPIKTNIIIELPLCMFPQTEKSNNPARSASSSSGSSDTDTVETLGVDVDKTSTLPSDKTSDHEDLDECYSDEMIKHDPSEPSEGNIADNDSSDCPVDNPADVNFCTEQSEVPCDSDSSSPLHNESNPTELEHDNENIANDGNSDCPVDNPADVDFCPEQSEVPCDSDSSCPSHNESNPTESEHDNEANPEGTTDCFDAHPNESVETAPDSEALNCDSEITSPDDCELPSNDESVNIEESCGDDHDSEADEIEVPSEDVTQDEEEIPPPSEDGHDSECSVVDDSEIPDCTEEDTITEELIPCPEAVDETSVHEEAEECNTPEADDEKEISATAASEATTDD